MVEGWSQRRLGEVVAIKHGFAFAGEHFAGHPTSSVLLTPGNFRIGGGFKAEKMKYYDGPIPQEYVLPPRSLIVTMTDLSKNMDTLGYPAWSPDLGDVLALHNQRLGLVEPVVDDVDLEFIYYVMCGRDYRHEVQASSTGTTVHHTSPSRILNFTFDCPPLSEQRGISATLGSLDQKVELNRRTIALLEELARAYFARFFATENTDDDGIALSHLIDVNPRRVLRSGERGTYVGMAALPEFSAEIYQWEERSAGSGQRFQNGDILMARITPCLENGKTAVVDMLEENEVGWGSTEYVVLGPRANITTPWIYCLVRTEQVRTFAIMSMTGTSGRQRFQADRFDQYKITPPGDAEIAEFNALALPVFTRMSQLRNESLKLMEIREALLPQLLSGRMRTIATDRIVREAVA